MRRRLYRLYWWLERRIHPALRFSQEHYCDTLRATIPGGCDWLDLGCGHQMFAYWMLRQERELAARPRRLIGIDRDVPALKANPVVGGAVCGDLGSLPFAPESFDVVTANMVVEHLEHPSLVLREVHRVLRPSGLFIFHTPNRKSISMGLAALLPQSVKNFLAFLLEARGPEDVFPTHYAMNTFRDISSFSVASGFTVREIRSVSTSAVSALLGPLSIVSCSI